ncbi:hypothetical protein ADP8_05255 (plasmid) [Roseomonas mucosa]|nr:hypothetical protein ADP8_05255 [Roseomonas mucosa]
MENAAAKEFEACSLAHDAVDLTFSRAGGPGYPARRRGDRPGHFRSGNRGHDGGAACRRSRRAEGLSGLCLMGIGLGILIEHLAAG